MSNKNIPVAEFVSIKPSCQASSSLSQRHHHRWSLPSSHIIWSLVVKAALTFLVLLMRAYFWTLTLMPLYNQWNINVPSTHWLPYFYRITPVLEIQTKAVIFHDSLNTKHLNLFVYAKYLNYGKWLNVTHSNNNHANRMEISFAHGGYF